MSNSNNRNMASAIASAAIGEFVFNGYSAMLDNSPSFQVPGYTIAFKGRAVDFVITCTNTVSGVVNTVHYKPARAGYDAVIEMHANTSSSADPLQFAVRLTAMLLHVMKYTTAMGEPKEMFQGGNGCSSLEMVPAGRPRVTSGASHD